MSVGLESRKQTSLIMCPLQKTYVLEENQQPIAVQISIEDFQRLEAMIEEYGLMDAMIAKGFPRRKSLG